MIAKLQNPLVAAIAGTALSIGVGVAASGRMITRLLEEAAAKAPIAEPTELRQKGWDFWTIEIENLSNELKEERARLRKQSDLLDQRAARIATEEKELGKLRAEIDALRRQISDRVIEIGADEAKNLRSLAQSYTGLSPRATVAILQEMDDPTAVKILALMKADAVAAIFEEMSRTAGPDGTPFARRAAVLTEKLRLMNASKPAGPS